MAAHLPPTVEINLFALADSLALTPRFPEQGTDSETALTAAMEVKEVDRDYAGEPTIDFLTSKKIPYCLDLNPFEWHLRSTSRNNSQELRSHRLGVVRTQKSRYWPVKKKVESNTKYKQKLFHLF